MARFVLKADPTFTAKVGFPRSGGDSVDVELTFKHRTKSALAEWLEARHGKKDVEAFTDMVVGWDLTDGDVAYEFTKANVELLLENYIGVALATYHTYIDELTKHRAKN